MALGMTVLDLTMSAKPWIGWAVDQVVVKGLNSLECCAR
jgi:hypothetical protein